jgi:hypothetical protein
MFNLPSINFEFEGTPVAIAAMAVGGIVAVSYAPIDAVARGQAISALGALAGAAGGVAIPRASGRRTPIDTVGSLANAPARFAAEFGEG